MSDPLLSIEGLSTGYGDFQALFDVSVSVREGEVLGLVGANGAGKTTLFAATMGMLPRDRSMVRFAGEPIGDIPSSRLTALGLALVPEGRRLFRSLSVEENLRLSADHGRRGHWDLKKVFELFPILFEKRRNPATSLSGGQQQMVAIGRALVANPRLILFDEVSLGLAPIVIDDVYAAILEITGSGISAIVVEQDIQRARKIANRLVCLREGRITLDAQSADVSSAAITTAYFGG